MIKVYTDGACKGNPGPGGWGALIIYPSEEKEIYGGDSLTTNNRMELTAVIRALEQAQAQEQICLFSDSQYVIKGITDWVHKWEKNGWQNSKKKRTVS